MSTNRGYKIFDLRNYLEITENNPYKDFIGPISIAQPLYRSKLIFFVGTQSNSRFKPNELILWNDEKNAVLGRIATKINFEILDVYLTWNIVFVKIKNRILVFEIASLALINIIEDLYSHNLVSASFLFNPAIIAYVSNLNPSYIKIEKFISNNITSNSSHYKTNNENSINKTHSNSYHTYYSYITNFFYNNSNNKNYIKKNKFLDVSKNQMNLITGFREIDFIKTSDFGDYICVIGEGANRIHLYSLFDYELKFCLWRGSKISKTIDVCFDLKCKFMSVLTDSKTLHIFKLYENQKNDPTNKVNKKMVEHANTHRFSKFQDLQFGNYKQSLMKKIKVLFITIKFFFFYLFIFYV